MYMNKSINEFTAKEETNQSWNDFVNSVFHQPKKIGVSPRERNIPSEMSVQPVENGREHRQRHIDLKSRDPIVREM
jgi:hypothetical protein